MKKQIDFDFSKWGQPGITVTFGGTNVKMQTLHQHPTDKDNYYGITESGSALRSDVDRLTMYYEQIPREFYMSIYDNGATGCLYNTFDECFAKRNVHVKGRVVKVREVLDETN